MNSPEYMREWRTKNADYLKVIKREWYLANRERILRERAEYRTLHKERIAAVKSSWSKRNRERLRAAASERMRAWRAANPGKARAAWRLSHSRRDKNKTLTQNRLWREKNRDRTRAYHAARRAAKAMATPPWTDKQALKVFYAEAVRLTKETGVAYHVDHIVPLRSKLVCGLHNQFNLQVIPERLNHSKRNLWWPDMPEVA